MTFCGTADRKREGSPKRGRRSDCQKKVIQIHRNNPHYFRGKNKLHVIFEEYKTTHIKYSDDGGNKVTSTKRQLTLQSMRKMKQFGQMNTEETTFNRPYLTRCLIKTDCFDFVTLRSCSNTLN